MNDNLLKKLITILLLGVIFYLFILLLPFILSVLKYLFIIVLPFLIAFVVAFILQPLVEYFKTIGLSRRLSVWVVISLFISFLTLIITTSIPYFLKEVNNLNENLPYIIDDLEKLINNIASKLSFLPSDYQPTFDNVSNYLSSKLNFLVASPEKILKNLFRYLSIVVLVPMLTVYFLLDYEKILCYFRNKLIAKDKVHFRNYLAELNKIMGSYFRGTFFVMIIFSMTASTLFMIIGLDFALFFGVLIGITNIIPYIGPYLGASFPILYALIESSDKAFLVVILCFIMQFLENNFLTPYVQSKNLKIHPILIIFSLIIFGNLFGLFGMVFALPILSIIVITLKYYPKRK